MVKTDKKTTYFCVEAIKSKRKIRGKLGHLVTWYKFSAVWRKRESLLRQRICHVTKFYFYLSFTVNYFYKNIGSFKLVASIKIVSLVVCQLSRDVIGYD